MSDVSDESYKSDKSDGSEPSEPSEPSESSESSDPAVPIGYEKGEQRTSAKRGPSSEPASSKLAQRQTSEQRERHN